MGHIVDAKAAVAVRPQFGSLYRRKISLGDAKFLRQFGRGRLATKGVLQLAPRARQLLSAPPDRRRISLVVHHHQIAGDSHLVAVRSRIVEHYGRHQTRVFRIRDVEDRCTEVLLVRDVPDIGIVARNGHLPRPGQIEVAKPLYIAPRSTVFMAFSCACSWRKSILTYRDHALFIQRGTGGFDDRSPFWNFAIDVGSEFLRRVTNDIHAELAK